MTEVKIINYAGVINDIIYEVDEDAKHQSVNRITLINKDTGKKKIVNIDRIRSLEDHGSLLVQTKNNDKLASCPICHKLCPTKEGVGTCDVHGDFSIIEHENQRHKKLVTTDLTDIAQHGELWIKKKKDDDHPDSIIICCLIFETTYLSFNLYNGSLGKKNKELPIKQAKEGNAGYELKSIDKQRKKLRSKGYELFGDSNAEETAEQSNDVDYSKLTALGSLFVREKADVINCMLVLEEKYVTFNIYNNTFSSNLFDKIRDENFGYEFKSMEKVTQKFEKKGYMRV